MGLKPGVIMDLGEMLIDFSVDDDLSTVFILDGPGDRWRQAFSSIIIDGPVALTGTVKLQVSHSDADTDSEGTTWRDFQSGGADVTIPADGSVEIASPLGRRIRISSSGNEVADRRFRIRGVERAS
jgi:hypothetical protein